MKRNTYLEADVVMEVGEGERREDVRKGGREEVGIYEVVIGK